MKFGLLALTLLQIALTIPAHADEGDGKPYKLTLGDYRYSDGNRGQDLNLRWRRDDTSAWIGAYHDRSFGTQTRLGFDSSFALAGSATLQPSLQVASRGFVGGSLNFQVGDPWFMLLGWGRTNLKPYFNLNFDPNDAITAGGGWHGEGGRTVSLTVVADDRLHTHQKDWHLYGRWPWSEDVRITVDLMNKTGEGDGGHVNAWGLSAGLDFRAGSCVWHATPSRTSRRRMRIGWRWARGSDGPGCRARKLRHVDDLPTPVLSPWA